MNRNIQTVIKSGVKRRFGISNKLVCAKVQAGVDNWLTHWISFSTEFSAKFQISSSKTRSLSSRSSAGRGPTRRRAQENKQAQKEDPKIQYGSHLGRVMLAAGGGLAPFPAPHSAPRGRDSQGLRVTKGVCVWVGFLKTARKCEMRNRAERAKRWTLMI